MTTDTLSEVKERPILFSTAMVQAIQQGRKTQTRRLSGLEVINANPDDWTLEGVFHDTADTHVYAWLKNRAGSQMISVKCPYGKPGDGLWVRETWGENRDGYYYKADFPDFNQHVKGIWKPSIHMPKNASRFLLKISDIRVERLQGITEADAIAEGIADSKDGLGYLHYTQPSIICNPIKSFATLWQSINGAESWEENPWVWVVAFERVTDLIS